MDRKVGEELSPKMKEGWKRKEEVCGEQVLASPMKKIQRSLGTGARALWID